MVAYEQQQLQEDEQEQQHQPLHKMVRFVSESENQVLILEADEDADAERSLAEEEYIERKEKRKQEAEECKEKGYGILLMDSFEDPVSHVQKHVTVFAQLPDPCCGRGLERQVSNKHDWERREWRTKCVQNVLAEESKLRYQGAWNDEDLIWDKLASVSRKASRSAKRFARRMGKADEFVVQHGELEDLDIALSLINEVRAVQLRINFQTARSLADGGHANMGPAAAIRSRNRGRRASFSAGMTSLEDNGSVKTHSSRGSKRLRKSKSDRALDKALKRSPFHSADSSDDGSKSRRSKRSTRGPTSSPRRPSFLRRLGSFNKRLGGAERGVDTVPASPGRPNLLPSTNWRSSPKRTSSETATGNAAGPITGRRRVIQRWNSWHMTTQNNSFNNSKKGDDNMSCKSLSDHSPKKDIVVAPRRYSLNSAPSCDTTVAEEDDTTHNEEEDLYGANTDFDDSIVFNRRRKKRSARQPKLATLEEGENSFNNDSSNNGSPSSFFAKWGGKRITKPRDPAATELDGSAASLDLADICLPGRCNDDDDEDDSTLGSSKKSSKKEITPIRRRGEDSRPKAPPATRWSSSMPALGSMPEDETPKEISVDFGSVGQVNTKRAQLLKAEQWAMCKSTSALNSVDEDQQSVRTDVGFNNKRRGHLGGMSDWESAPVLSYDHDEKVEETQKSPTKRRWLKKFMKRWSLSFRRNQGKNNKISEGKSNDTKTKTNRRGLLTRWTSKSEVVVVKPKASRAENTVLEVPSIRTVMEVPIRGLMRHNSTPALFGSEDVRRAPERTHSGSTVDSFSTSDMRDSESPRDLIFALDNRSTRTFHGLRSKDIEVTVGREIEVTC